MKSEFDDQFDDQTARLTTEHRAGGTGPADPVAARPIIFASYIDSEKCLTETAAADPIIFLPTTIYTCSYIVNKVLCTIYIYAIATTRNSKLLL